ncbi:AraC family transcriptional regulator [Rhizobium sp. KVB221]|uniref:AraC family transcriptional regulator n=1 Tax=Rhizobium setariae TaxID=2801340 RepID=A0A936YJ26_9HYPH|nr:AraC family transcriptional regulator [Rhizobium setariae]MBL0371068.1 AraC family transcriptional regulator [Rhizobium setariae]
MNIIENAIWQVESNLRRPMTLEEIAAECRVTPSYLTRAFAAVTGSSLMRYARARRLTEAARILALGVPDILSLALDAGYGSHEAFTRAFREHFGTTPESVRDARRTGNLELTEPMIMDATPEITLAEPTFEKRTSMLLVGLVQQFQMQNIGAIPSLWEKFNAHHRQIPNVIGTAAYGASLSFSDEAGCEYMCGVEVSDFSDVPPELTGRTLPAATYAKFRQPGHITLIRATIGTIWNSWLPKSGYEPHEQAPLIEYYPPKFNSETGAGGFEIWIPVKTR